MARKPKEAGLESDGGEPFDPEAAAYAAGFQAGEQSIRDNPPEDLSVSILADLLAQVLTHTHATARLPADLLAKIKGAVA